MAQPKGRPHKTTPRSYNLWPGQPKKAKIGIMHLLGRKFSKMTAPNFGPNSLCGPSTVFQGTWPNQGGGPTRPPKKLRSLKLNILKPKMAKTGKLHLVGTKFSKMTAPNFGSNSLGGPSTVFQGTWPNQRGGPTRPPQEATICGPGNPKRPKLA